MAKAGFNLNTVIVVNGIDYRLQRKLDEQTWQLEEIKTGRYISQSVDDLTKLYMQKALQFRANGPGSSFKNNASVFHTEEQIEIAQKRKKYVLATLGVSSTKSIMEPVLKQVWQDLNDGTSAPPSVASVCRWKATFKNSNEDITSLVPNTEKRGNYSDRYPKELVYKIKDLIDQKWLTKERPSIQELLDFSLQLVRTENMSRSVQDHWPIPTRRLITRLIEELPAYDVVAARFGVQAAIKKFRSVQKNRVTDAPLVRVEIDHTPLDLFVLDDETLVPLGRPYLTVCLDDFTRSVLGIHIGFEPPSYLSVAHCLRHAFLPKIDLKDQCPDVFNEWHAYGIPQELVVDNGLEFHSKSLEAACFSLGVEIHYSARKTPWFKGKIERFLGTLNRAVAHGKPGTTFSNIFEKGDYDPVSQALITYKTLKEIAIKWIVDVYHQKEHRALGTSPAIMWKNSIVSTDILLPETKDWLDAILGKIETRQLTAKGIELYGLQYNSPELNLLRRATGDMSVELRINDSDLGSIVVVHNKEMYTAHALKQEYAKGLSKWQHDVCKKIAKSSIEKPDENSWLDAKMYIANRIAEELGVNKKSKRNVGRYKDAGQFTKPTQILPVEKGHSTLKIEPDTPMLLPQSPPIPKFEVKIKKSSSTGELNDE